MFINGTPPWNLVWNVSINQGLKQCFLNYDLLVKGWVERRKRRTIEKAVEKSRRIAEMVFSLLEAKGKKTGS
jgi:hypothetical protein